MKRAIKVSVLVVSSALVTTAMLGGCEEKKPAAPAAPATPPPKAPTGK